MVDALGRWKLSPNQLELSVSDAALAQMTAIQKGVLDALPFLAFELYFLIKGGFAGLERLGQFRPLSFHGL